MQISGYQQVEKYFHYKLHNSRKDVPLHPQNNGNDSLAQQVEHIPFKDGVLGSNPKRITSIFHNRLLNRCLQAVFYLYVLKYVLF